MLSSLCSGENCTRSIPLSSTSHGSYYRVYPGNRGCCVCALLLKFEYAQNKAAPLIRCPSHGPAHGNLGSELNFRSPGCVYHLATAESPISDE